MYDIYIVRRTQIYLTEQQSRWLGSRSKAMRSRASRSRGIVLLMALAMLAIVGAAIMVLASAMSLDGKRTFDRARAGQLDQMLLAGAA